jgi:hypothetical protein
MLKRVKTEFFYLYKLLREGYGPKYWLKYLKNRFFTDLSEIRPTRYLAEENLELHVLCQKQDVLMLAWALKSFLNFSQLRPEIIVHDDGSIDRHQVRLLEEKFSSLRVLSRKEADKQISELAELSQRTREYRNRGHKLNLKLIDILALSRAKKVIVMDSDILFFGYPKEIVDFVRSESNEDALASSQDGTYDLGVQREYQEKHQLIKKEVGLINSGFIIFNRDKVNINALNEYYENTTRAIDDYFVEMAGWGSVISQLNFRFLPLEKYIIKGKPATGIVMKHFTGPRRHEMYAYGIDMIKSFTQ